MTEATARFIETAYRPPAQSTSPDFPFVLNTGRIRDQWHTMTRTAKTPRLMSHIAEPFLEIHPEDAARLQLEDAELAEVKSLSGRVVARVLVTPRQSHGSVFVPLHWTDQFASGARVGALIESHTDPVSGQPELKAAPVSIARYQAKWYGFAVSRNKPSSIAADYWAVAPARSGWRAELAGLALPQRWDDFVRHFFALDESCAADVLTYHDARSGQHRFAVFEGEQLLGAFFASPEPVAVSRGFVSDSLANGDERPCDRLRILAGRTSAGEIDQGAIVCSCFDIGLNQIIDAVTGGGCITLDAVGAALKAGSNCGSCRPEIGRLSTTMRLQRQADGMTLSVRIFEAV